ncbi:unnamed protein product [Bathycoccus prasinos]
MPALTKRSLATRLARLEKKLGVDISLCDDDDIEEEDALKKEVEEKEEQTEVKNIRSLIDVLETHVSGLSADGLEYVWFDTSMN